MKTCGNCKQEKETSEFPFDRASKDGLHRQCRVCLAASRKIWRKAHLEHDKAMNKAWHKKNKVQQAARHRRRCLKRNYGLSTEDFEQIRVNQQDRCAICHTKFSKTPNVDHCHSTGTVRGLLCQKCNHGIGLFKDSPGLLQAAANYLLTASRLYGILT